MSQLNLYRKFHSGKDHTSIGLFRELNQLFDIEKVLYPGSHVHITPSLVFSDVVYADSFRDTYKFYKDPEVAAFVNKNKRYDVPAVYRFFQQDYNRPFSGLSREFDLIISQYAGFVGQATKQYLKRGGLLVCNDSHGDASMAVLDSDFELIGVYQRNSDTDFSISSGNLEEYFVPKKPETFTTDWLNKNGKGAAFKTSASGYLFRKLT